MELSFSAAAKGEICRCLPQKHCCALSQCFGILLFCNSFSGEGVKIITESREFAGILPRLFKKAFSLTFDQQPRTMEDKKLILTNTDPEKLGRIMEAYGFDRTDTLSLHINLPIVEEECCRVSFLRGAFLSGGSVTAPSKGSHMEVSTYHQAVARECEYLMRETLGFSPKQAQRSGCCVLYLKQSEQISDFLTYLGAPVAAMGIMEARLEKELNNKVNRRCNCDDANISKVVEAAQEQLAAIRLLKERDLLDTLPGKLQQAAKAREENPESSLSELAGMMDPPITKPAMNHRLKRLVELSREAQK